MTDILQTIQSQLPTMTDEQRLVARHVLRAMTDPHYWMTRCTKTKDEQDPVNPYKPFPDRAYFLDLNAAWEAESVLTIEKSRTMMCSWWAAARALHTSMVRPATRVLFMAQDEDRSLVLVDYCRILYEQQEAIFKQLWPLDRPFDKQKYNTMELQNSSSMWALPGKDESKIRSEHPTIVIFDEAAFIERYGVAMDIALATRVPKLVAVTSANPGDFRNFTIQAEPVRWPYENPPTQGVSMRRIPAGVPGEGTAVIRLHYTADPTMTPERLDALRKKYTSTANWEKEMEICYEALEGARLYPEYIPEQNDCEPFDVSDPSEWTIWHACDPHMRTPHAFAWEAFNREGDSVICGELWTRERYWGCREWAAAIEFLESDSDEKPEDWAWARGKKLRIARRVMDTHGSAANSEEGADFFATYRQYGLHYQPATKGSQALAAARDKIGDLFIPSLAYKPDGSTFMWPRRHIFRTCREARFEYLNVRFPEGDVQKPSQEKPKTYQKHIIDCAAYIHSSGGKYIELAQRQSTFSPIYKEMGW